MFLIIKIKNFRGDLSDITATTATLDLTDVSAKKASLHKLGIKKDPCSLPTYILHGMTTNNSLGSITSESLIISVLICILSSHAFLAYFH